MPAPVAPKGRPVFIHIPKCGGTSVDLAIRDALRVGVSGRINPIAARRACQAFLGVLDPPLFFQLYPSYQQVLLLYHLECGYPYVSGHLPVNEAVMDAAPSDYGFLTLLRDPVDRWVSHYIFNKMNMEDPMVPPSLDFAGTPMEELENVLSSLRGWQLGTMMTTFLAGRCPDQDEAASAVDAALGNLRRFTVVGFLDDLPHFEDQFRRRFGAPLEVGHVNRTRDTAPQAGLFDELMEMFTGEVIARVADLCACDQRLYDAAGREFRHP